MSGYWAVGSFVIATYPAIVVRIAMTIATIGRRTKNAPIVLLPGFFGRRGLDPCRPVSARRRGLLRRDLHAAAHPLDALDHDAVARIQPLLDHPHASVPGTDGSRPDPR